MHKRRSSSAVRRRPCAEAGPAGVLQRCETMPVCLKRVWNAFDMRKGPGRSESGRGPQTLEKTLLRKGLAELSRPQTTEGKEAPSFPATRASEMTPLMTDRATFLPESSPVRHASLCRKRPRRAFFDKPRAPAAQRAAGALGTGGERKRWPHSTSMGSTSTGMRLRSSFVRRVTLTMAQRSESPS